MDRSEFDKLLARAAEDPHLTDLLGRVARQTVRTRDAQRQADRVFDCAADDPVQFVGVDPAVPPVDGSRPKRAWMWQTVAGHPGYVGFDRKGTYAAKEHLKKLGGFWKRPFWLVPEEHAEEAADLILQAERGTLPNPAPSTFRSASPPKGTATAVKPCVCWVCGMAYTEAELRALPGNRAETYYCGCAEPGAPREARFRR